MCSVFGILVSIFLWLAVYFQRKIHDELKLVMEMVIIGILWLVFGGAYVLTSLAQITIHVIPPLCVIVLAVLSFLISFGMPIWLAWVSPKDMQAAEEVDEEFEEEVTNEDDEPEESKEARELLKKGEKLDDVMTTETQWRNLFLEFMSFRMCEEGFHFYQAVQKYRKLEQPDLQLEFQQIRHKFIGSGAPFQVNIPDYMVKNITSRAESGPPTVDIFDEAFVENRKVLVTDVFPAFKAWKKTKELTGTLKQKMDPANWPRVVTRRRSTRVNA
jgi:hypothetical protein